MKLLWKVRISLACCLYTLRCLHIYILNADIGITEKILAGVSDSICMSIVSDKNFDISVFIIPAGKCLPLHDHPNMSVISKLIQGELQVRGFNMIKYDFENKSTLAEMCITSVKSSFEKPWLLTPSQSNIHEFKAISTCAILDVLMPPYQEPERPCNYYAYALPSDSNELKVGERTQLIHIDEPSWSLPYAVRYRGPRVVLSS